MLWEADGPVSLGDLGARLHLDSDTLTPLIRRLAQLGRVVRQRDPDDERRVLITLSTQGAALRDRATDVPARTFSRFGIDIDAARVLRDDPVASSPPSKDLPRPRGPEPGWLSQAWEV